MDTSELQQRFGKHWTGEFCSKCGIPAKTTTLNKGISRCCGAPIAPLDFLSEDEAALVAQVAQNYDPEKENVNMSEDALKDLEAAGTTSVTPEAATPAGKTPKKANKKATGEGEQTGEPKKRGRESSVKPEMIPSTAEQAALFEGATNMAEKIRRMASVDANGVKCDHLPAERKYSNAVIAATLDVVYQRVFQTVAQMKARDEKAAEAAKKAAETPAAETK